MPESGGLCMYYKKKQILATAFFLLLLYLVFTPYGHNYLAFNEKHRLSVGDSLELLGYYPKPILNTIDVYVKEGEKLLSMNGGNLKTAQYSLGLQKMPIAVKPGHVKLELKLFGLIPIKSINVDVLPNLKLIPGGHSIGVLLRTDGVMIVGYSPVMNEKNEPCFPAKDAGIMVGDVIIKINGEKMLTDDDVKEKIASLGKSKEEINITIKRNDKLYDKKIQPQYCIDTNSYRIGLFVRDNAGGVGTLTFYDPYTKSFGALGHVITDSETNQQLIIRQGKILIASVENIQKAQRGIPGEKVGVFLEDTEMGTIDKNESCGIFGKANKNIENSLYQEELPVGYSKQINTGDAEILTVLKGSEIQRFSIKIEKIMYGRADGKNLIIRITDKKLLNDTGGIVQGMSGSPIIQDGKIIGAVTHVFVNDPERGYGVFIENMLIEADILKQNEKTLGASSQGFCYIMLNICRII